MTPYGDILQHAKALIVNQNLSVRDAVVQACNETNNSVVHNGCYVDVLICREAGDPDKYPTDKNRIIEIIDALIERDCACC